MPCHTGCTDMASLPCVPSYILEESLFITTPWPTGCNDVISNQYEG